MWHRAVVRDAPLVLLAIVLLATGAGAQPAQQSSDTPRPEQRTVAVPSFFLTFPEPAAAEGWKAADGPGLFGWDPRVFVGGWTRETERGLQGICVLAQRTDCESRPLEWAAAVHTAFETSKADFTAVFSEAVVGVDGVEVAFAGATGPATLPLVGYGDQTGKLCMALLANGPDVVQMIVTGHPDDDLRTIAAALARAARFSGRAPLPERQASGPPADTAVQQALEPSEPSRPPTPRFHRALATVIFELKKVGVETTKDVVLRDLGDLERVFEGSSERGWLVSFYRAGRPRDLVLTVLVVEDVTVAEDDSAPVWRIRRDMFDRATYVALAEDPYEDDGRVFLVRKGNLHGAMEIDGDWIVVRGSAMIGRRQLLAKLEEGLGRQWSAVADAFSR